MDDSSDVGMMIFHCAVRGEETKRRATDENVNDGKREEALRFTNRLCMSHRQRRHTTQYYSISSVGSRLLSQSQSLQGYVRIHPLYASCRCCIAFAVASE